jgi:hypothetical protein
MFDRLDEPALAWAMLGLALTPNHGVKDMVEAALSLPRYPSTVIACLMRNAAREAVKHNIRAQGHKLSHYAAKDITRMAEALVVNNREVLLAGALRTIERSPELRRMLEKEQREWTKRIERNLQVKCNSQTAA